MVESYGVVGRSWIVKEYFKVEKKWRHATNNVNTTDFKVVNKGLGLQDFKGCNLYLNCVG